MSEKKKVTFKARPSGKKISFMIKKKGEGVKKQP